MSVGVGGLTHKVAQVNADLLAVMDGALSNDALFSKQRRPTDEFDPLSSVPTSDQSRSDLAKLAQGQSNVR